MANSKEYEMSSGNVFKDLGFENSDKELLKAQLAYEINTLIKAKGMTQVEAATKLGITQPDISKLKQGHYHRFEVSRLLRFLTQLGRNVNIQITDSKTQEGQINLSLH